MNRKRASKPGFDKLTTGGFDKLTAGISDTQADFEQAADLFRLICRLDSRRLPPEINKLVERIDNAFDENRGKHGKPSLLLKLMKAWLAIAPQRRRRMQNCWESILPDPKGAVLALHASLNYSVSRFMILNPAYGDAKIFGQIRCDFDHFADKVELRILEGTTRAEAVAAVYRFARLLDEGWDTFLSSGDGVSCFPPIVAPTTQQISRTPNPQPAPTLAGDKGEAAEAPAA